MTMRYKSRKGSYIMEAAIVLPVIITAVITIVLIILFFYSQTTDRSRLHIALRCEAGRITEKTTYTENQDLTGDLGVQLQTEGALSEKKVTGEKLLMMEHKGILTKKGAFLVKGAWYQTDGAGYVRTYRLVKGEADEE